MMDTELTTQQVLCHCLTCRKITGSTNTVCLVIPDPQITFTGTPKRITTMHEAGVELEISFCGDCGSSLYKEMLAPSHKGLKIVFAGTLDNGSQALEKVKPEGEIWVKYRVSWVQPVDGAAQMQAFK